MPLIKRYPNRKLYDTDAKKYITLDEIAEMVRNGSDVTVIDHESGEDVTSLTLTQIILEQEKKKSGYLSTSALAGLIRSGGNSISETFDSLRDSLRGTVGDTVSNTVRRGIGSLGELNRHSEEQMGKLIEQGKLTVEQAQGLLKLDGLLDDLLHSLNVPTQKDIRSLQEQIQSLNERLAEIDEDEGSGDTGEEQKS